ncbi:MAG: ImmA/IrrE family metallo-endopeptidase [Saccharofermentanales bacterium]
MDRIDLWKKASALRRQLGEDSQSPIDIFTLAYNIERLSVVFYPMGERLSGMCVKSPRNNVIAINSGMSVGRQRFSMAHELFHLYFDTTLATSICATKIGSGQQIEKDADRFASYFLMPPDSLAEAIALIKSSNNSKLTVSSIVKLEQHFGVSRQAILFRLVEDNELANKETEFMRQNIIRSATSLGYDDSLYKPLPPEKQYMTYGYYIKQADEILSKGLVSIGKYEELLLDAFRTDLVYGNTGEGGELID